MIKMVIIGLWMPFATLVSSFATVYWLADQSQMSSSADMAASMGGVDYETVRPVNVPILADGALQGYVVAKLVFTADADVLRQLTVPPHPFLIDEAFRLLYADERLNFRQLERYDLEAMTLHLKEAANKRIGQEVVRDVLVEEFNYFDKDDVLTH